ncbi:50S ribosomal protein L22 [Rickettsiales bacterium (ex Bugula neritina AB1)]|nr:50S ribosomal protein L22 [Rickettsiales bacterium (ex Bugula neritina AB1)]
MNKTICNTIPVKAFLKNGKISPRKAVLVVDLIRGKKVEDAKRILEISKKKASFILLKLLKSAISNGINNFKCEYKSLIISKIWVGNGRFLKRTEPRSRGSANRLLKRYSNIWLYLEGVKNG